MSAQHTPGPWRVDPRYLADVQTDNFEIAFCINIAGQTYGDRTPSKAEGEANARLIAAAPELLEALRDLVTAVTGRDVSAFSMRALRNAEAAIAKATGGAA